VTSEYLSAYFSTTWNVVAPVLGDHLWQSTLYASVAGLLTLALRKHQARTRYWLWFAASVKFLIPFSLLTSLGSYLSWSRRSPVAVNPGLYVTMEQISQPFTQSALHPSSGSAHAIASTSLSNLLPALIALWLFGFFVVLLVWCVRWRRVSAAIKSATPLCEGREVGALRRIECVGGVRKPIEVLLSPASLEPGIFGIARPVLLWPEGI
jgi:beta-lactamase regulating signal transducer with metallopeptidase domain